MRINRVLMGAVLMLAACLSGTTIAQGFPEKTVTLVVPYPVGGSDGCD